MAYPSTLSSLTDPQATDRLNSPSHSALHQAENAAIEAIEAFVGTSSSTAGTLIYDIRAAASNGGGHVQTADKGGTGQTSYTKGDILVASSSSVLTRLAVGTNGRFLTSDSTAATGVNWAGGNPTSRVYLNASVLTWTKPAALAYIEVELVGGGGGGGRDDLGGAGGAAGSYIVGTIPASVLNATETLTIAASVTGSTNGNSTSFGAHLIAGGGYGSSGGTPADSASYGGTYISSVAAISSFLGTSGYAVTAFTPDLVQNGSGGDSPYGKGGVGRVVEVGGSYNGIKGSGYGSGGSGTSNTTGTTGGGGAQGLIIIREY